MITNNTKTNEVDNMRVSQVVTVAEIETRGIGNFITRKAGKGKSYLIKNVSYALPKRDNRKILMTLPTNASILKQQAQQQLIPLRNQIMNNGIFPKLEKIFNVFMCEAAIGKTYTIIETLKELSATTSKPVKTLIVTKFINEGKAIADDLNKLKSNMAIDKNSENKEENEKDLKNYEVLIITHAMYKILCEYPSKRRYYIEGRTNLIIDEELNMVEMDSLGDNDIDRLCGRSL